MSRGRLLSVLLAIVLSLMLASQGVEMEESEKEEDR